VPAILFDLDDTLFDHRYGTRTAQALLRERHDVLRAWDESAFAHRHSELLEAFHLEVLAGRLTVDEARVRRFATLFAEAGRPLSAAQVDAVAMEYRDAYRRSWRLVPGALDTLGALRDRGVRLGIVTNNVVEEQTRKIAELGLAPLFDAVVISEAVGVSKPDPRIFRLALDDVRCPPGEALMVGDSWSGDIVGAVAAGLRAVWFNPGGAARPDAPPDVAEFATFAPSTAAFLLEKLGHLPFPDFEENPQVASGSEAGSHEFLRKLEN
jgi:putative hydrolase of the HAD superfamily